MRFKFRRTFAGLKFYGMVACIAAMFNIFPATAQQGRLIVNLNQGWHFTKDSVIPEETGVKVSWKKVNLPHSWNSEDVMDDKPDYYRAACWYRKELPINESLKGKKLLLQFDGANQVSEVYINGQHAGTHIGGYTAFSVPVDEYINFEETAINTLLVKVDNSHNDNIPPLSADFTFFGGIYRNVNLIVNDPVHFLQSRGASSIFITTPSVSEKQASVLIRSVVQNQSATSRKILLRNTIQDASGKVIKEKNTSVSLKAGERRELSQVTDNIQNPSLWTPENPYLYRVFTQIKDAKTGEILDQVTNPLGLRWFKFDANTGFHLNGKPYKLIGASRHQDFKGMANAIPDNYHYNDVKLLKDMGANFLRVAHYPQDQTVLNACDALGILTSIEIPVVNAITETEEFYNNCRNMQVEMIRQNYNHPSVILWGYMNEIMLRPKFIGQAERQKVYYGNITKLAQTLDSLTRAEDPTRYTMIAHHGDFNRYKQAGLIDIPQVVGWNLYQGWYSGSISNFSDFLDRFHKEYPNKPLMVTEYGADADPRIRSLSPERFDKSIQYSLNFHDVYLKAMLERPFVAAGMIWNLADFNSETREETMPHINNKGLLTLERNAKDLYRFYQSQLLKRPFISISDWRKRSGITDSASSVCTQELDVFSNATEVELFKDGVSLGSRKPMNGRFTWLVPFSNGQNRVEARCLIEGKEYRDVAHLNFDIQSRDNIQHLNVLLGARRFFEDDKGQEWIPSTQYKQGSWGYIGGTPFKAGNTRQSYGTDRNIKETDNDPIYQTQVTGIQKYKLDVADGEYSLTLHFAELTTSETKEALAYNLDNSVQKNKAEERVFNISINKVPVLQKLNIAKRYGPLTAGFETIKVTAENGKGIEISFDALVGQPVLNALQLTKIN
ncbi:glycoside hydrolase family 2 TIM barrel-domain containing protein [Desertivirga brevis]|uniref:glycoside hydrolase family 2 TIM barrel-domain containing protein n=1 Tax=Desertivirga brevis TaxID=2810310 RepID=UPI001F6072F0|nr:glycoside hydrolase family 2 TIM barrel-domain containing protein [Pedobacter sp. SYSU D00873]